jgi:dipeptidyl aminopeptidase/acylaminoacyl peptidase
MKRAALSVALVLASVLVLPAAAERPRGSITIERIADIKYPTSPAWSPDGQRVAFLWDAAGKQDVFVVAPGQPQSAVEGAPVALTDFTVDPHLLQSDIGQLAWMSNDEVLFGKDGQLWSVSVTTRQPKRFEGLSDAASFTLSPDRRQIAFLRQGQIWIASLAAKTQRKLTNIPAPLSASVPVFSSDGRWLAFTAAHNSLETEDLPWNGNLVRSVATATADRIIAAQGGDVAWVPTIGNVTGVQWTAHGSIVYQEQSPDGKTREIKTAAVGTLPRVLWRDYDSKWWSPTNRDSRLVVSPDGKMLTFVSDRTGWIHVYVIPTDATGESQARQLTTGDFGAGLPAWSPDGSRIAYHHSVKGNQMERFISIVDLKSGAHEQVVTERGVNIDPAFSPDGSRLLFQRTDVYNSLDLYVAPASARNRNAPIRLSNSMPAGLNTADFAVPTPVYFPSRLDGKQVPATLMVTKNLDRTRKHPAIVWIHGSGSDQNYLGWHPGSYRMYYSASLYLAQQGYVVITPDYRGSSGYSRDWATGVHMGLGVSDAADVASSADYLKTLDYVDPDRIGVWGLSYGGYLTLQALTRDPLLFRCGINVAGVVDWATYGAGYTTPRLGTPIENPEIYRVSAPIYHVEKLARPLLVLHGTNDRNVAFRDSLRLWDQLLKLGKDFEMGVYPGEIHFFRRAHILRDAWRRAEDFFDRHLKQAMTTTTASR